LIRRTIAIVLLSLGQLASAQQRARELDADDISWMEEQSRKIRTESAAFEAAHPFKGRIASDAIEQLQGEGFVCAIEYLNLGTSQQPVRKPYVRCRMPAIPATDLCKNRTVSIHMDWPAENFDESALVAQLKTRAIQAQYFYCESRESGPPKHQ